MAEIIKNIVDGLMGVWVKVQELDMETVKNWVMSGGGALLVGLFIKYGIPFFKNSNKPILIELAKATDQIVGLVGEVKRLSTENKTIKDGIRGTIQYLEVTADVNLSSKVLTQEQKDKFLVASESLKLLDNSLATVIALEVEKIVEDGIITSDEALELAEKNKVVEKAFGTQISTLMK